MHQNVLPALLRAEILCLIASPIRQSINVQTILHAAVSHAPFKYTVTVADPTGRRLSSPSRQPPATSVRLHCVTFLSPKTPNTTPHLAHYHQQRKGPSQQKSAFNNFHLCTNYAYQIFRFAEDVHVQIVQLIAPCEGRMQDELHSRSIVNVSLNFTPAICFLCQDYLLVQVLTFCRKDKSGNTWHHRIFTYTPNTAALLITQYRMSSTSWASGGSSTLNKTEDRGGTIAQRTIEDQRRIRVLCDRSSITLDFGGLFTNTWTHLVHKSTLPHQLAP